MELQASQPNLNSWEAYDTNPPGNYFQLYEGQEGHWEQLSMDLPKAIIPNQPGCLIDN